MSRETRTTVVDLRSGCWACHGGDARWNGPTAMMLAARHHDATGHRTWAQQTISVRYGPREAPDSSQADLFSNHPEIQGATPDV